MDRRALFTGIGIGLMFATVVLMFAPEPAAPTVPPATPMSPPSLDKSQVEQWVKENQYVLLEHKEWEDYQELKKQGSIAPKRVTAIYILPGMSSKAVENLLIKSGLLPEENHFAELMKDQKLSKRIRSGMYIFEGSPSAEDIIEQITY